MDHSANSARLFDDFADRYGEKYMDLTMYDESYRAFCELLPPGARVLDAACGPGNVSRYLRSQRPDLKLLGIDLAPRMVELAREAVPSAEFRVHDCRRLHELRVQFDGIICAFGLPYLSPKETAAFIRAAGQALGPGGALYLSTMLGGSEQSGFKRCSTGDEIYIFFHAEAEILSSLDSCGFRVVEQRRIPSPDVAPKRTVDLIVIAKSTERVSFSPITW